MRHWDFERWLMFVMGLVILGGVGYMLWMDRVADELQRQIGPSERKLAEIGAVAEKIDVLKGEMLREEFIKSNNIFAYIEQQEAFSRVGKGTFDIDPAREADEGEGYEDIQYGLRLSSRQPDLSLRAIAQFLGAVEQSSNRLTVTRIRLNPSSRRGADGDAWKPDLTLTDRRPVRIE